MRAGDWLRSRSIGEPVQVIDVVSAFGRESVRVWVPATGQVAVVTPADLTQPDPTNGSSALIAAAAAARITDALATGDLIAPTQSVVDPLPHQLRALSRCVSNSPIRMLLADEVGLGKTIEAGLVLTELMVRGLARRVLIVAPKGLVAQWQGELARRFDEDFVALTSAEVGALAGRREDNFWLNYDRLIIPLDSVKPLDKRRGWDDERIERYNIARSTNLAAAGWDVVVIDEAHRVAGYGEQVARHRLGRLLADASPNILLLTATPHVGKSDGFRRVLSLLDERAFIGDAPITPDRVQPYVVRTSKRVTIDSDGSPLFLPRTTTKVSVEWPADRSRQEQLYADVTAYVQSGYALGRREKNNSLVFLMLLMQRLVSSSTRAIEVALERRLASLQAEEDRLRPPEPTGQLKMDPDFWEVDANEQLELVFEKQLPAMRNERATVKRLLQLAAEARQEGIDAKLKRLYDLLVDVAREENDPLVKVLVFTEFLPTQELIVDYLSSMGVETTVLNGSMTIEEREQAQEDFAGKARVLVSTEAGGEGLNLQVAHLVVNYDIPWNPMRIEQRIGRVDRIGQTKPVRAFNLILRGSVEDRVHDVLEEKLARILTEFGVDKLSDVLDSSAFEATFQQVYADVAGGLDVDEVTSVVAEAVEESGAYLRDWRDLLGGEMPDPLEARRMRDHPLPRWMERFVTASVIAEGGSAERQLAGWQLTWADGRTEPVAFTRADAALRRRLLTIADDRVASAMAAATRRNAEPIVPILKLPGADSFAGGVWSLWLVVAHTGTEEEVRAQPVFIAPDGEVRLPSARVIWDRLLEDGVLTEPRGALDGDESGEAVAQARAAADELGRPVFEQLRSRLETRLRDRRSRFLEYVERRREIIQRVGLENVRNRRLAELEKEKERELATMPMVDIAPELRCAAIFRVAA